MGRKQHRRTGDGATSRKTITDQKGLKFEETKAQERMVISHRVGSGKYAGLWHLAVLYYKNRLIIVLGSSQKEAPSSQLG